MIALKPLTELSTSGRLETVVHDRLRGLNANDQTRILAARGLAIAQVMSKVANKEESNLAVTLFERECVRSYYL